jgi:NADH-quinone oxidoreductase subunit G
VAENTWVAEAKAEMASGPIKNAIADFYLTNPIARASSLMAELSANAKARRTEALAAE